MDVDIFLQSLKDEPEYADQIVHVHTEPARVPDWVSVPVELSPDVQRFLAALDVSKLYRHQDEAIEAALKGQDILITTGPASGKSLCYQVPILQRFLEQPEATALFVFPTKALARDQVAAWNRGVEALGDAANPSEVSAMPFDGDANAADRRMARDSARLLVTNPEMLHANLLPNHSRWSKFFQGLSYVVLDEVHTYTGFFGANMANVIRRLERICEHYNSRPQFVCSSATVGNPKEVAELITGRNIYHINEDTSAAGSRTYVFWNPPRIKSRIWRGRRSANVEAHELMVKLIRQRISTICFSKARNTAEMIYRYVRESLQKEEPALANRVIPYRGGYSPQERRDMEKRLREGELLGVSATRALELGIDIGSLEVCIVVGYPGTLNAFFQQTGRAGRGGRNALCVLVGTDTPINQYIMNHPEFIFDRPIERAVIDLDNPFVVLGHLHCATAELPVKKSENQRFGYATNLASEVLEEEKKIHKIRDAWYHTSTEEPAHEVRLRGYGDESTVIMDADSERVIDRLDKFRALRIFYPGAIYFHRGDTYAMVHHDTDKNVVQVRRIDVSYYTDPVTGTAVDHVDAVLDQRPLGTGEAFLGEVFAVLSTPMYEKVRFYTMDRISQHPTDVSPVAYEAMSFWLTTPPELPKEVGSLGLNPESGMMGILYCVSRILPLFLTSDANDFDWSLGCRNTVWHTMFWYEFYKHGIGHAEQGYERLEEILVVTLEHLLTCDCEDGCPNCTSRLITPYHVRNIELGEGIVASRRAAVVVLNSLLTGQSASESLELLNTPREERGQQFLPTVTGEHRQQKPHQIRMNERTRSLMLRKVERARSLKQPVDHPIDPTPSVGILPLEKKEILAAADSENRSGHPAIRRTGDSFSRKLRRKLDFQSTNPESSKQENVEPVPSELQAKRSDVLPSPSPVDFDTASPTQSRDSSVDTVIQVGDEIARRARKLKRKKKKED